MPSVRVRENEYFDAALRRFKRACEKAGVLTELRRREFYEKADPRAETQKSRRRKAAHEARIARRGHAANKDVLTYGEVAGRQSLGISQSAAAKKSTSGYAY